MRRSIYPMNIRFIKKIAYILLFPLLMIYGCMGTQGTNNPVLQNQNHDYFESYKFFYGKWQVTECITGSEDQYEEIKGAIIEYDEASFAVNGEIFTPEYKLSIIPITENPQYYFSDGSNSYKRMSVQDLGIGDKYFVVVRVTTGVAAELGTLFFIRDDGALVIMYGTIMAIANRLEHYPINYTTYYHPI